MLGSPRRSFGACVLVTLALALFECESRAQISETWTVNVPAGPGRPSKVAVDPQGHVVVAGYAGSGPHVPAFLAAYDPQGVHLWTSTFAVPPGDGIFIDFDFAPGGRIVALDRYAVVSYDAAGTQQWFAPATSSLGPVNLKSSAVDAAGNTCAAGIVPAGSWWDLAIAKYSPTGTLLASATWDGGIGGYENVDDVAFDAQGNLYVCGQCDYPAQTAFVLLKFDPALNLLWVRKLGGGSPHPEARGVVCGLGGEAYVCGGIDAGGYLDFGVVRFDPDGTLAWVDLPADSTHIGGFAADIVADAGGDVVAVGLWGNDGLVRRYTPSGTVLWSHVHGTAIGSDLFGTVDVDAGGDVLVGGAVSPPSDSRFVRFDREGHLMGDVSVGGSQSYPVLVAHGDGVTTFVARAVPEGTTVAPALTRFDAAVVPFCFGDGVGTSCPCGNVSATFDRAGCTNSRGTAGRLGHDGFASLSSDDLVLLGTGMPNDVALYFQGSLAIQGGAGALFGDGLRCVGGTVVRLGAVLNSGNQSQYPNSGAPSVSTQGQVGASGIRYYQVHYRNSAAFCSSETFNLTNALEVTWLP